MKFYSTNNHKLQVPLRQAVIRGLASDNGLYMPVDIPQLPNDFFTRLPQMSFVDIATRVASELVGDEVPRKELKAMVQETLQFDAPVVQLEDDVYCLELFHGPTMAFKDFGARFMSQLLGYFAREQDRDISILVATSGDTGSAVANGFFDVPHTRVTVLYPSGKVSEIQEKQFATLGRNVTAVEVEGTFDDCQRMVKQAFLDDELQQRFFLTSANSINIARLIPQTFYYFNAYAQLATQGRPLVFAVPSGNFGNLTGGLIAKRMGLPVYQFVAATNINDIVPTFLETRIFEPKPSVSTISNAMDVGNPSNFVRMIELYHEDFDALVADIAGYRFTDEETRAAMRHMHDTTGYVLDPHGAIAYLGLRRYLADHSGVSGVFLETAHPGKFKDVVEATLGRQIELPAALRHFQEKKKQSVKIGNRYEQIKDLLLNQV